ncbi:hypothetical protein V7S43_004580 [Phytophthora oleae]|uniref:Uncharacterized protein n=1 Tax=Phytophthora oleae TaxID=2107226 RepID=A0ABD3FWC6_9STRA
MLALHRTDGDRSYITGEVIEERFYTFGGVARECFSLTEDEAEEKRRDLTLEIAEISSPRELETFVNKGENLAGFHLVVHFVPKLNGKRVKPQLASRLVVEKLAERMLETGKMDRESLRRSLEDIRGGAALAGWIFETDVHETLARGCTLELRRLPSKEATSANNYRELNETMMIQDGGKMSELVVIPKGEPDVFTLKNLSAAAATRGPYHKPEKKQFESIGGFYIPNMEPGKDLEVTQQKLIEWNARPENRVILVHTTISKHSSVDTSGMLNVLRKLGLVEAVKDKPERVALVFIVPDPIAANLNDRRLATIP